MKYLLSGLGTMVAGVITYLIIYNFVSPTVITGTDTGSNLLRSLMPLIVAAIVMIKRKGIVSPRSNFGMIVRQTLGKLNAEMHMLTAKLNVESEWRGVIAIY
jgi:hypothetical protein